MAAAQRSSLATFNDVAAVIDVSEEKVQELASKAIGSKEGAYCMFDVHIFSVLLSLWLCR